MTQIAQTQDLLSIGHYTLFFSSIAVASVFAMDMARFKKWSISTLGFTSASIIGMLIGILLMDFLPEGSALMNMSLSVISTILISAFFAFKFQTLDEPVNRKARGGT